MAVIEGSGPVQHRRRIGTVGTPASLLPGQLAINDPQNGSTQVRLYAGTAPSALYSSGVATLVSDQRQVELTGNQTIIGTKTIDISHIKITGGAAGNALETDGLGNLAWGPGATNILPEPTADGQIYGRNGQNATWVPVLPLSGSRMTGPLILNGPPNTAGDPNQAATMGYVNTVGQKSAQFLGTLDAPVGEVFYTPQCGITGNALVDPTTVNGAFVICINAGTLPVGGPAAGTSLNVGDWLYSDGTKYDPIHITGGGGSGGGSITGVSAGTGLTGGGTTGNVTLALTVPVSVANGGTGSTTASGGLDGLAGFSGTQTGIMERTSSGAYVLLPDPLTIAHGGTNAATGPVAIDNLAGYSGASTGLMTRTNTGTYILTALPLPISAGGTGSTTLAGSSFVQKAGDTMTGLLVLSGNATANLNPVPLQQLNTTVAGYLPLAGGVMTGPLTLSGDATTNLGAVTLQQANAILAGGSSGSFVSKTGDTMTGTLVINAATALNATGTITGTNITANGALTVSGIGSFGSTGITFPGITNGAHNFGFGWDGTNVHTWVDGTDRGLIATQSYVSGNYATTSYVNGTFATQSALGGYLPLTGGTITGSLTVNSNIASGSTGISYPSIGGGGHTFSFSWDGTAVHPWVDGQDQGEYASRSWVSSNFATTGTVGNYLPLSGGTVSGPLTVTGQTNVNNTLTVQGGLQIYNGATVQSGNLTVGSGSLAYNATVWGFIECHTYVQADNSGTAVYTPNGNVVCIECHANNFVNTSDAEMKTDIDDLPICSSLVGAISPRRFRWKEGPDTERRHWGFVAQDVEKAVEDAGYDFGGCVVFKDDEERKIAKRGLDYSELVAVLWQAVRELKDEVESLKKPPAPTPTPATQAQQTQSATHHEANRTVPRRR